MSALSRTGINLLAVDFDLTFIDVHTGGCWAGSVAALASRVRPYMKQLVDDALSSGLYVAIVTFSPQVSLISQVLISLFPANGHKIIIRGRDGNWSYSGVGALSGKQPHMASVVEELSHCYAAQICRKSTLLIDDDPQNVGIALNNGVNAILCCPSDPSSVHRSILAMIAFH